MVTMQHGFRSQLEAGGINVGQPIHIRTSVVGKSEYDFSCFGLDLNDKALDERYVIFYNQPQSPKGEISIDDNSAKDSTFQVNLALLPLNIQKLSFAITTDGQSTMRDVNTCNVQILQNGQTAFSLEVTGKDFQNQKAIITIEVYNKNGWRVSAVANGFNFSGGLDALMAHYGVDVASDKGLTESIGDTIRGSTSAKETVNESVKKSVQSPIKQSAPPPDSPVDNGPASGKNAEGFDRTDNDWV